MAMLAGQISAAALREARLLALRSGVDLDAGTWILLLRQLSARLQDEPVAPGSGR